MMEDVADKEAGWVEWLQRWKLDDPTLTEKEAYLRYQRFSKVDFGEAPQSMWPKLFQDLLKVEGGLVFGDAIGLVEEFRFKFAVKNATPHREKPKPYAKDEREWIRNYLKNQVDLGILRQVMPGEPEPVFAVGAVLVKEG